MIVVLIGILVNNARLSDVMARVADLRSDVDARFNEVSQRFSDMGQRFNDVGQRFNDVDRRLIEMDGRMEQRFDDVKALWRSELHRVEEVLDARLKHLEER